MKVLVTGGAGFIGSAVVRRLLSGGSHEVVNLDALTYAGNLDSLRQSSADSRYFFEHADIGDADAVRDIFRRHRPQAVLNLAAESHVDRSIDGPGAFVSTNVVGTYTLLQEARRAWSRLDEQERSQCRFVHVSTDEVFGSLGLTGHFSETSSYQPSSPYAATKAAADHLVRAWYRTYALPCIVTNCSNNYGPYQFPEKLIPLIILNAIAGKPLPVYGRGENVRDWLYVDDHAEALVAVLERGQPGETYTIGGHNEQRNLDVVHLICAILDEIRPDARLGPRSDLICMVADRPGHDLRYAIDATHIRKELGWEPRETFASGLRKTVQWYLENSWWWERVRSGVYRGERLGLPAMSSDT